MQYVVMLSLSKHKKTMSVSASTNLNSSKIKYDVMLSLSKHKNIMSVSALTSLNSSKMQYVVMLSGVFANETK